jgi:hypothetical protein
MSAAAPAAPAISAPTAAPSAGKTKAKTRYLRSKKDRRKSRKAAAPRAGGAASAGAQAGEDENNDVESADAWVDDEPEAAALDGPAASSFVKAPPFLLSPSLNPHSDAERRRPCNRSAEIPHTSSYHKSRIHMARPSISRGLVHSD